MSKQVQISLDDVTYTVNLTRTGPYYHASWNCPSCGAGGTCSQLISSKEAALRVARLGLMAHHEVAHSPRTRRKPSASDAAGE
jgi:hypothetical protein